MISVKVFANVFVLSLQSPDRLRSRYTIDVMVYILGIIDLCGGPSYGSAKTAGRISSRVIVRLLWVAQHLQCNQVKYGLSSLSSTPFEKVKNLGIER